MKNETLTIVKQAGRWVVVTDSAAVAALMGTNVLPTPYAPDTPRDEIVTRIKSLNPDSIVK